MVISVGEFFEIEIRARCIRFLEVASRVVWSAPAAMRAEAASVRP